MRIKQDFFSGERPRIALHLVKDSEGQIVQNCDLSRGDLRAFRANIRTIELTETGTLRTLYQWKKTGADEIIVHANELDFVRSPIAGEEHDRVYLTGMTEPRVLTDSILSTPFVFTTDYYKLGVPAPAAALSGLSGYTGGGTEYRAYIYTYVVKLGTTDAEEGSNSPIISISNYTSGDVTLAGFTAPPANRSIGKIRIYRTSSGTAGVAEFLFVGEFDTAGVDFSTYTAIDNVAEADLGEAFTCEDWVLPPTDMTGIIAPDGGSLVGFSGNRVYFSEPYLPHAWPYSYPVDATIVGLGSIGNTVVVLTDESIYLMTGQAEAISTQKLNGRYPCRSKAGIVSCDIGVLYPSDEGIVLVNMDGPVLLSFEYLTKEQFADYNPSLIRAAVYEGKYFGFHNNSAFLIDTRDKTLSRLSPPATVAAILTPGVSLVDNRLYFIGVEDGGADAIYEFASIDTEEYQQYFYRSKDYILGATLNFSAARVLRDPAGFDLDAAAANAVLLLTGSSGYLNDLAVNGGEVNGDGFEQAYVGTTFRLYADGTLIHTETIDSDDPFRLPGGSLYKRCYYELEGDIPVVEVALATSMEEIDAA